MKNQDLEPCPICGGKIILMYGITRVPQIFARCEKCENDYDLPDVKLKILKHNGKISKTTLKNATKAWQRLCHIGGGR